MSRPPEALEPTDAQKLRTGWSRLWHAGRYSFAGLRAAWSESAFRLEAQCAAVLVPLAFWLGRGWVEVALLVGGVLAVMVVELLNTAVETTLDRFGPEWDASTKKAKDMGSAAVLLTLLACGGLWLAVLADRFLG
ncbi:MAG: diacylglycerol kinase [Xylophilus ampelinus]